MDLLSPDIIFLQLTALNGKFSPRRVELFPLLGDLGHIFGFLSLKCGDLLIPLHELLVKLLNLFLGSTEIEEDSLVPCLKVTVSRVHVVELGFELESELHLLLMIFRVLSIVFL